MALALPYSKPDIESPARQEQSLLADALAQKKRTIVFPSQATVTDHGELYLAEILSRDSRLSDALPVGAGFVPRFGPGPHHSRR